MIFSVSVCDDIYYGRLKGSHFKLASVQMALDNIVDPDSKDIYSALVANANMNDEELFIHQVDAIPDDGVVLKLPRVGKQINGTWAEVMKRAIALSPNNTCKAGLQTMLDEYAVHAQIAALEEQLAALKNAPLNGASLFNAATPVDVPAYIESSVLAEEEAFIPIHLRKKSVK